MSGLRRVLVLLAVLYMATPYALAQKPDDAGSADAMDREFGPRVESAINLCVSDASPNVAAIEARAASAGWPAFESIGNWRVVTLPPGQSVLLSFGLQAEPITDSAVAGTALSCSLLVPQSFQTVLMRHLRARFSSDRDIGMFSLDHGVLRELHGDAWPSRGVPQIFEQTPADQRLVLLTTETRGEMFAVTISVMHRTQPN